MRLIFQIHLSQKLIERGFYTSAPLTCSYFYDLVLKCPGYITGTHIHRDEPSDVLSTEDLIAVP